MRVHLNIYQIMALKLRKGIGTIRYYPAKEGGESRLPG